MTDENQVLKLYEGRIDSAKGSLMNDINLWLSPKVWKSTSDTADLIRHHVEQFSAFSQNALAIFDKQVGSSANAWERADFRALVIGMLTTRWLLLRETASQRILGSPYRDQLSNLDELTAGYYFRVRHSLMNVAGETLANQMLPFAPRVCLGRLAEITVFNRNVPLILSVPIGAVFDDENNPDLKNPSRLAIAHEIGHAFLLQFPELIDEVKQQLQNVWVTPETGKEPRRTRTLRQMMLNWCEETLADMIGTALAGTDFADSAFIVMATSEAVAGLTDGMHPPAPVRPFSHITMLQYIASGGSGVLPASDVSEKVESLRVVAEKSLDDAQAMSLPTAIGQIQSRASSVFDMQMSRQFKSLSVLAFVTLETVKKELIDMVNTILTNVKPALFGEQKTVGDFLAECYRTEVPPGQEEKRIPWGEISQQIDEFALEFSSHPDDLVAGSRSNEILCTLFGLTCS